MLTRIFKEGDRGNAERAYQKAIQDRADYHVPGLRIDVDGIVGDQTLDAAESVAYWMGVMPYKGGTAAARRRQAVILGATRTPTELARAQKLKAARKKAEKEGDADRPKIANLNLDFPGPGERGWQGELGALLGVVGHYSGGAQDTSDAHAFAMWRNYHAYHRSKGWGGEGYHIGATAKGTLVCLRPFRLKGTHVAGANTGRLGFSMHGTTGDRPTLEQMRTFRWWLLNGHTDVMPASHRAPRRLDDLTVWGHNDLNSTSCPGSFKPMYKSHGRSR